MRTLLIKNATIVNEGKIVEGDVLIKGERIEKIGTNISAEAPVIDASGLYLLPGVIDDQVHFREPGLTHKGDISTESRAAVAGGITSYMEMPNVIPQTTTQKLLEEKYLLGAAKSAANFSFYIGATNDNLEEVLKTDPSNVCGIKVFMGSSTGNMLVDNPSSLEKLFSQSHMLIATHCEDEKTIRRNEESFKKIYGENIPVKYHPLIRSEQACYLSSSSAVALAKKHNTRLHILHLSTAKEMELFSNAVPLREKKITAEACVHHLWFNEEDYERLGTRIKWNPAVKTSSDRRAILDAVLNDTIDVIATDHAPHTWEEKQRPYLQCPSGGPLVQHSLVALLELHHQGKISIEKIVQKMSHAVADCFRITERGYIREGYYADLVLVNLNKPWKVVGSSPLSFGEGAGGEASNILYKCGWSPFEGVTFKSSVTHTFVSGHLAYNSGQLDDSQKGMRLTFKNEK